MTSSPARTICNVLLKTALLLIALNILFALVFPMPWLGRRSLYNRLFPGRERLPFGENPAVSYNLSLYNLDAMFAAHRLSADPKPAGEYRVLFIGDSSIWGTLLRPAETLPARVDAANLRCDGRPVRAYNLGYPTLSVTKDLLILAEALPRYQPDLIIWGVTLEALVPDQQLASPLAANNAARLDPLIRAHHLNLPAAPTALVRPDFWQRTLIGQRRPLADLLRLQLYGFRWAATGIDQEYPASYTPAQRDLDPDPAYHGWQPGQMPPEALAFDVLTAGQRAAGPVPILLLNEPILISPGQNSDVRYNFFYPRWAYDAYRTELTRRAAQTRLPLLDAWDLLPPAEFTNSAIHLTPAGSRTLADLVGQKITALCAEE